jgi:hypothetical protein
MRWHQPRPPRTSASEASRKSTGWPLDFTTVLCELRAASYLASAIGNGIGCTPALESDAQVGEQLDLDFLFDACIISSAPCFRRFRPSCTFIKAKLSSSMAQASATHDERERSRSRLWWATPPSRQSPSGRPSARSLAQALRMRVFRQLDEPNWNQRVEFTSILSTSRAISDLIYVSAWPLELYDIRRSWWQTKAWSLTNLCKIQD